MKHLKKIIIYLSIFCFITVSIFSLYSPKVYAEVPSSQKVVSHTGAWTGYAFNYSLMGKYFTIQDPTGIPTGNFIRYFYTDDNISFYALEGKDLYTAILNRGIGIVVTSSILDILFNNFIQNIQIKDTQNNIHVQGGLYDSNNNFLGYCVNDISGCYYQQPAPADTPAIDVPGELTNDVYNHYKYYTEDDLPNYITVYPPSIDYLKTKQFRTQLDSTKFNTSFNGLLNYLDPNKVYINVGYDSNSDWWVKSKIFDRDPSILYFLNNGGNETNWINFCNDYSLTKDDNSLLFTDAYPTTHTSSIQLSYYLISNDTVDQASSNYYRINNDQLSFVTGMGQLSSNGGFWIGNHTMNYGLENSTANVSVDQYGFGHYYTIYKNQQAYLDIKNKNYSPDSFTTPQYINYNPANDNSFTVTNNNIDNSQNLNQNIYEDSHDNFENNTDNSTINNTEINNNTQTIINNYYPDPVDPDDPTNPDDPDNPSDPEDPETILDAILDALRRFFAIIGRLLGTVLAGLLEVIDSVLGAIADIADNFTGVTDFISAIFAWLPSPVPQVIAAGLSITILAAIIRFIRG